MSRPRPFSFLSLNPLGFCLPSEIGRKKGLGSKRDQFGNDNSFLHGDKHE